MDVFWVIVGAIGGAVATAILGGMGYLGKRWLTNASSQEKTTLYSDTAELMIKLRDAGVSLEEVKEFESGIRSGIRRTEASSTASSTASAKPEAPSKTWTQTHMNLQATTKFHTTDAQLNEALVELRGLLSDEEEAQMDEAQDRWAAYRNAEADFIASEFEGGSMQPLIRSGEGISLTEERLKRVRATIAERKSRLIEP